jgi:hypothetical protein
MSRACERKQQARLEDGAHQQCRVFFALELHGADAERRRTATG